MDAPQEFHHAQEESQLFWRRWVPFRGTWIEGKGVHGSEDWNSALDPAECPLIFKRNNLREKSQLSLSRHKWPRTIKKMSRNCQHRWIANITSFFGIYADEREDKKSNPDLAWTVKFQRKIHLILNWQPNLRCPLITTTIVIKTNEEAYLERVLLVVIARLRLLTTEGVQSSIIYHF